VANLYGVASPNPLPVGANIIGGADISCPSNTETNVVALTFNNPTVNGFYYPFFIGFLYYTLGGVVPTNIFVGYRLGAGADFVNAAVGITGAVASASYTQPIGIGCSTFIVNNPTGTNTFNISLNPSGQAITARVSGTFVQGWWVRATDQ
jgi:hypothetical protein